MKTLILAILVVSAAGASRAQAAGKTRTAKRAPVTRSAPVAEKRAEVQPVQARTDTVEAPAEPPAEARPAQARTPKAKVYNFTGLDVEGKLKTPQLLYFLNRVKLELDTTGREKRSFLKELEQSSDDKGL
jgi:hypothetical protein